MHIEEMQRRAVELRARFADFERGTYGKEWSTEDLVLGLMADVGDLAEAVQRVDGRRPPRSTAPRADLEHELSDCLWVLLVLAHRFDIDVATAFTTTVNEIEAWLGDHSDLT